MLFYSYTYDWLGSGSRAARRGRVVLVGGFFGALAVTLMISRIQVAEGVFIDTRNIPIALIALFEGWPAGLVAAGMAAAYRGWLGGSGMVAGMISVLAAAGAGGLVRAWAGRDGRVGPRHAFALGGAVFLVTLGAFALLGGRGLALFSQSWLHFLVFSVVGIGVLARFFQDVAERARLTAERERFRAILDEASEAIRIVDADTLRILECNLMDCHLSGYSREAMIGRDVREFCPEEPELRAWREASLAHVRAQGAVRSVDLPHRTRSGKIIQIDSTRRIVEHRGRRYELVIYRDAAERQAAEAAHREVTELRAITLVAGAAAHEINNPLTVVVGSLELLARQLPKDGPEGKWIERAVAAGRRIQEIVLRMNRITRVESTEARGGLPAILDLEKSSD